MPVKTPSTGLRQVSPGFLQRVWGGCCGRLLGNGCFTIVWDGPRKESHLFVRLSVSVSGGISECQSSVAGEVVTESVTAGWFSWGGRILGCVSDGLAHVTVNIQMAG